MGKLTRERIRQQIRSQANLHNYGSGFSYVWMIKRDGKRITGAGSHALYKKAQEGDVIKLTISYVNSPVICAQETITL